MIECRGCDGSVSSFRRSLAMWKRFFALRYFAGLRHSEALALRVPDCQLPKQGWDTPRLAEWSLVRGSGPRR